MEKVVELELLAPARNADIAIEAIKHGADAVYIGAPAHGARAAAGNSLEDISRVVQFAHRFGARVYVTVNTIIRDDEIAEVECLVNSLNRIGVDALIVQDLGVNRMSIPPIALHASTQCDIRTAEKARFLRDAGFEQIVLARELSISEMAAIHEAVPDCRLEAFVHGALCVSFSGNCQAGWALQRRSANRGECPQICRQEFDLIDGDGNVVLHKKNLLSLKDLNRIGSLSEMIKAGVTSFKIEGRLKDISYVKTVVAAYRKALDEIIASNKGRYRRSSFGRSSLSFTPNLTECFNRGYTDYFTFGPSQHIKMASFDTPKWIGNQIGKTLRAVNGTRVPMQLSVPLSNGDGIGFFDRSGRFCGARVNRVEGDTLYLATPVEITAGTVIYRNRNKTLSDRLESDTARRTVQLTLTLRSTGSQIVLDAQCERGAAVTVTATLEETLQEARTPQAERRAAVLRKTGDTIYSVSEIVDRCGNLFIPASLLADLRRRCLNALDSAWRVNYRFNYRLPQRAPLTAPPKLTYHDNVANHLAREFYEEAGATDIEPALEVLGDKGLRPGLQVMETRYCLRRELGACLLTPQGRKLKGPLSLRTGSATLHANFDCKQCLMKLYI